MRVNNLGKTLNPKLLDTNKDTVIITTLKNKGVGHLQTFKFCQNKKNQSFNPKLNPPYFPNDEQLGKCKHTIRIRTLENGRVGYLKIPK